MQLRPSSPAGYDRAKKTGGRWLGESTPHPQKQVSPLSQATRSPAGCGAAQIRMITLASLGTGSYATVATFVSSWEVQRSEVLRISK